MSKSSAQADTAQSKVHLANHRNQADTAQSKAQVSNPRLMGRLGNSGVVGVVVVVAVVGGGGGGVVVIVANSSSVVVTNSPSCELMKWTSSNARAPAILLLLLLRVQVSTSSAQKTQQCHTQATTIQKPLIKAHRQTSKLTSV
jgi:hypothetical protein